MDDVDRFRQDQKAFLPVLGLEQVPDPMVGHIAETDQVAAIDFRAGNTPPNKDNLAFIQQCEGPLPDGVRVKMLRIDAAGYQEAIIRYCDAHEIGYCIRAKMSGALKALALEADEGAWQPLLGKKGKLRGQESKRYLHCIGNYEQAFTVVLQRQVKRGQRALDLGADAEQGQADDEFETADYIYRAIATNQDDWNDSKIVYWYFSLVQPAWRDQRESHQGVEVGFRRRHFAL